MSVQGDWSGVRERVITMASEWRRSRDWAPAESDLFVPVLTETEVAEVEAYYGVPLPPDYRSFLTDVGAGGIGPWTGHHGGRELSCSELSTLCQVEGAWGWTWVEHDFHRVHDLSGPLIPNDEWRTRQRETLLDAGHEPGRPDPDSDHLADYVAAFGEDGKRLWHEQRDQGAVQICGYGCGMTGMLVVVGEHRGEVLFRDCDLNPPLEPEVDANGNPHTFRTWYLDWLDYQETELGLRPRDEV